MRQIGKIDEERSAHRFAAFLITQRINAHAESNSKGEWCIWVRDENDVEISKPLLAEYLREPDHERYEGVEKRAYSILREEKEKRAAAQDNYVEMRGRWSSPGAMRGPAPLTIFLIVTCALIFIFVGQLGDPNTFFLTFFDGFQLEGWNAESVSDRFIDIRRGQIWRLFTPSLLHGDGMHIAFNMLILYYLGGQVERIKGKAKYAIMLVGFGVAAALAQTITSSGLMGGMSGVNYGLFGYIVYKMMYQPNEGFYISTINIAIMGGWFLIAFGIPNVANMAHAGGLVAGVLTAAVGAFFPSRD